MPRTHLAALTLFLAAAASLAQPAPPATEEPALSGPKVAPALQTTKTLVHREFDGKLKRHDDPLAAALDLLELDAADRVAVDAVISRRNTEMDAFVRNHLREIAELAGARQAGDTARARELMRDLLQEARPMLQKDPLVDQVADALPAAKAAELKRLHEEYITAATQDRMDGEMTDADNARRAEGREGRRGRFQANMAERLQGFGQEIRRSYERVFSSRTAEFQELVTDLGLSPELESKVQRIFVDLFQKTYGKPTKAQSTKAFLEAYALLDPEQRAKLRERLAARDPDEPSDSTPAPKPPHEIPTPKDEMGKP